MKDNESIARKWLRLRQELDEAQREADKAQGACDELQSQMFDRWGFNTADELAKEVGELMREKEELGFLMAEKVTAFQKKWDERLK